jgi:hypothetical protein
LKHWFQHVICRFCCNVQRCLYNCSLCIVAKLKCTFEVHILLYIKEKVSFYILQMLHISKMQIIDIYLDLTVNLINDASSRKLGNVDRLDHKKFVRHLYDPQCHKLHNE